MVCRRVGLPGGCRRKAAQGGSLCLGAQRGLGRGKRGAARVVRLQRRLVRGWRLGGRKARVRPGRTGPRRCWGRGRRCPCLSARERGVLRGQAHRRGRNLPGVQTFFRYRKRIRWLARKGSGQEWRRFGPYGLPRVPRIGLGGGWLILGPFRLDCRSLLSQTAGRRAREQVEDSLEHSGLTTGSAL